MSRRQYLRGCGPTDENGNPDDKVRCPIWCCSGHLYTKTEKVQIDNDSAWQLPNIICDDCGTVFMNSLLIAKKAEVRKLPPLVVQRSVI